jgi:hypothetical protein
VQRCTIIKTASKFSVLICAAAFFFLLGVPPAWGRASAQENHGTSPVLNLQAYEAELEHFSIRIDQMKGRPGQISEFRKSLPSEWTVAVGGAEYHISLESLDSALANLQMHPQNADSIARDIKYRLAVLRQAALELEKPEAGVEEAAARSQLNKIFQRREFAGMAGPSAFQLLEERITRWLFEQIARLLAWLHISSAMGNTLAWIFIGCVFLVIVYWVFRTLATRARRIEMPSASPNLPVDSRMWVSEALAAAERGEYREAIHCAYWAAIARLEDIGLLSADRSRTPRESLRLLSSHATEQSSLRDLTSRFELVWYGGRVATAAEWSGAKAQLEKFGCLVASTQPTANS